MPITDQMAIIFVYNLIAIAVGTFLCAFTVRERLRVQAPVLILLVIMLSAISCFLRMVSWLYILAFIVVAYFVYARATSVQPVKLVYILLNIVTYLLFLHVIFFLIEGTLYDWGWDALCTVGIGYVVTCPPIAWLMRKKIWPQLREIDTSGNYWLLLIPASFLLINALLSSSYVQELLPEYIKWPYAVLTLVFTASACGANFLMLSLLGSVRKASQAQASILMMEYQLQTQANRFAEITRYVDEIRLMRHDMRHHLRVIRELLDEGSFDQARLYLKEYERSASQVQAVQASANFVGDIIARHAQERGYSLGIDVDVACDLPVDFWMRDSDLTVVWGGLIEKAFDACKAQTTGRRFIHATARVEENEAVFTIENSRGQSLFRPDEDWVRRDMAVNVKGYNTASIEAIVGNYAGDATFITEGDREYAVVQVYRQL